MRHKHLNAVFLQLKRKALKRVLEIPLILETFNFTGYQIGIIFVDWNLEYFEFLRILEISGLKIFLFTPQQTTKTQDLKCKF